MWGRFLTRIFALFGMTLTCVACYGTEYTGFQTQFSASGRVCDKDGKPIQGIKVGMLAGGSTYTDNEGGFYVQGDTKAVTFTDVDGMENGGAFETLQCNLYTNGNDMHTDMGFVYLKREGE